MELPPTATHALVEGHEIADSNPPAPEMTLEAHLRPFQVAVSSTCELGPVRTDANPTHLRAAGQESPPRTGTDRMRPEGTISGYGTMPLGIGITWGIHLWPFHNCALAPAAMQAAGDMHEIPPGTAALTGGGEIGERILRHSCPFHRCARRTSFGE